MRISSKLSVRILLLLAPLSPSTMHAATGAHLPGSTLYPRLIRLHHAPRGPLKNSLLVKTSNKLFRSLDDGRTFTYLATVPTANLEAGSPAPDKNAADKERCCSTVYELPRKLGRFKAGTLLYAASFLSSGVPAIEIYTSTDQGEHWQLLSTPIKAGDLHHGLWEPEFTLARDRSLAMFFSDETDPCCSQKLVQMRTRDLEHWDPRQDTVASTSPKDRPGMAIVSVLPHHTWFMSYEICGPVAHCQVFFRRSSDGLHFGDPKDFGTRAVTSSGQFLAHAPANIFDPASHSLILVGQMLFESDGTVSPRNGRVLLTANPPHPQPWQLSTAPVEVPSAYDNYCPNYSSALMRTSRGLLELASDYDDAHHCTTFFSTTPKN